MKHLSSLVVFGEPNAQKRHRHASRGTFVQTYDPSKKEKDNFLLVAQQKAPEKPFNCPLFVEIVCYFSRPKSHFGSGRNASILKPSSPFFHTKKPDADNCVKFVLDALNGIFWTDDSIIVGHRVHKAYSERPRTEVEIFEVTLGVSK